MSVPCFLLDEHVSHAIVRGLAVRASDLQVFVMGEAGAPAIGTLDPEPLIWIEEQGCLLVSNNRKTMPVHLREHLHAGRHVPGILIIPPYPAIGIIIDELLLRHGASDQYVYKAGRKGYNG